MMSMRAPKERLATLEVSLNTLQHTATHWNAQQHTATHCNTLQHTATHCNTLQHTASHCITPINVRMCNRDRRWADEYARRDWQRAKSLSQHTATRCNTLQHTATHCSTLQDMTTHPLTWVCETGIVDEQTSAQGEIGNARSVPWCQCSAPTR